MNKVTLVLSLVVAAGFIFFGVQKFGATNPIFEIIADRSGISLFEPVIRILTGIAEIGTAILILIPRTRTFGAFVGLGVLVGAIGFHLSPWLGINVPGIGHFLFITAVTMFVLTAVLFVLLRKQSSTPNAE